MNIPISDIFEALFIFSISLWMLFDGWRMYFKEEKILLFADQLGFFLQNYFGGLRKLIEDWLIILLRDKLRK